jgi:hypothetical protein
VKRLRYKVGRLEGFSITPATIASGGWRGANVRPAITWYVMDTFFCHQVLKTFDRHDGRQPGPMPAWAKKIRGIDIASLEHKAELEARAYCAQLNDEYAAWLEEQC